MADKHTVRFEPVGIEIEVDEEQTVLRAAAEQGIMLMHGCKEGQCASCKSFVLDGDDIELDRYSTFALPDYEKEEGFTLLCRAHVYEDVTIELLNYDEEMIRSGLPIQSAVAEVVVDRAGHPRPAAPRAASWSSRPSSRTSPASTSTSRCPGTEATRSFSMANTSGREAGHARVRHQGLPGRPVLAASWTGGLAVGDRLDADRARSGSSRCGRAATHGLVFVGGGAGMAPILALLRSMAERGIERRATSSTTAPARRRDLCFEDELRALERDAAELPLRAGAVRAGRPTTTGTARSA